MSPFVCQGTTLPYTAAMSQNGVSPRHQNMLTAQTYHNKLLLQDRVTIVPRYSAVHHSSNESEHIFKIVPNTCCQSSPPKDLRKPPSRDFQLYSQKANHPFVKNNSLPKETYKSTNQITPAGPTRVPFISKKIFCELLHDVIL